MKKLTWQQFEAVFGRSTVEPGDVLSVNYREYVVTTVGADGITFEEVEDDDDAEE